MKKVRLMFTVVAIILTLTIYATSGLADESEGVLYTFCPSESISMYNSMMKNVLKLNETQAAILQVSSNGMKDGNLFYSDILQDTYFLFGGTTEESGTATTALINCSLKESNQLKNIPMLIWAAIVQNSYFGEIDEAGSSFLEWVNGGLNDGDSFTSPYFVAVYNEVPLDSCSLLLTKL